MSSRNGLVSRIVRGLNWGPLVALPLAAIGAFLVWAPASDTYAPEPIVLGSIMMTLGFAHLYYLWRAEERETGLFESEGTLSAEDDEARADPIEILKTRYAKGEVTDEEFERRLDRVVSLDSSQSEEREGERETVTETP